LDQITRHRKRPARVLLAGDAFRMHQPLYFLADATNAGCSSSSPLPLQSCRTSHHIRVVGDLLCSTRRRSHKRAASACPGGGRVFNRAQDRHIGHAATSRGAEDDNHEARKWKQCSDAACLRGSYRYKKYSLTPPPVFNRRKARVNRGSASS
jgi:hypothetical protein